jgi:pyruvate dehydrogenase E1 component alpha subunit
MHMGDMSKNIVAFVSMLADTIPVAAGVALAFKIPNKSRWSLLLWRRRHQSRDWHEGLNLASVLKVPVIFICNNNQYAYSTPVEKQMAVKDVSIRAQAYGMPGVTVDGNDILAVYEATGVAIERARGSGGPSLIECKTFRMTGHSAHDDVKYVPKHLFEEWEKKDPILRLETLLLKYKTTTEADVKRLAARIAREVDEAISLAENDPYPEPHEALEGVYADQVAEAP